MTARLESALAELVAAIRDEVAVAAARPSSAPPELLGIPEAARRLGIGRTALYDAIGRGEVRSIRIGRRRLIPADAISDLAAGDPLLQSRASSDHRRRVPAREKLTPWRMAMQAPIPDAEQHGSGPVMPASAVRRGPYRTDLGILTVCPRHPWAAPSLSIIDGTVPVCWEGGHLLDPDEVAA